jgi:4-amino-4-deoxy-L-arabinose transferase-like glycosyltransferase
VITDKIKKEKDSLLLFLFLLAIYVFFQSGSVYGGDSGDLISAATVGSFSHPPGYPLYSFLGWLIIKLPFYTPAWRMAWLSSVPSALALTILYRILKLFFPKKIALSSTLTAAFIYPVFLYSCVTEVFSLNSFFVVWLFYLVCLWSRTKKPKYLYWLGLGLGLSLSHHLTVLFSLPALCYLILPSKRSLKKGQLIRTGGLIAVGLLPYLYFPISTLFINRSLFFWGDGTTLRGFWQIITRQIYGPFTAYTGIANSPLPRLVNL